MPNLGLAGLYGFLFAIGVILAAFFMRSLFHISICGG
jgi:hypothetical protein